MFLTFVNYKQNLSSVCDRLKFCVVYTTGCMRMPIDCTRLMTRAIWERVSRKVNHTHIAITSSSNKSDLMSRCVDIYPPRIPFITPVVEEMIRKNECPKFGCPFIPFNKSFLSIKDTMCIPVSFGPGAPHPIYQVLSNDLLARHNSSSVPVKKINKPVLKESLKKGTRICALPLHIMIYCIILTCFVLHCYVLSTYRCFR